MNLDEVLKEPNNKLIAVDVDGTLAEGEFWGQTDPKPIPEMVDFVVDLYQKGAHIIIYTARRPDHYCITHAWLIRHKIPFHGITHTYKPGADLYIDDKSFRPEEVLRWAGNNSKDVQD